MNILTSKKNCGKLKDMSGNFLYIHIIYIYPPKYHRYNYSKSIAYNQFTQNNICQI